MNWQMLAVLVTLVGIIVNGIIFAIIKFNDLHHLHIEVEKINARLDKHSSKLEKFQIVLTDLAARFSERTRPLKKKTR